MTATTARRQRRPAMPQASAAPPAAATLADALRGVADWLQAVRTGGVAPVWATPSTLARVAARLGLKPFERDLLWLAAAPEIDPALGPLLAEAQGDGAPPWATFGLALRHLPGADWSTIAPAGRLRRWRLLELVGAGPLTGTALRVDETVLHRLLGHGHADPRLEPWFHDMPDAAAPTAIDPEMVALAQAWSRSATLADAPVAQLECGDAGQLVQALAAQLQLQAVRLSTLPLPEATVDREQLARLWEREALLRGALLWVEAGDGNARLADFVDRLQALVVTSGAPLPLRRARHLLRGRGGDAAARLAVWRQQLGARAAAMNGALTPLAEQFELPAAAIEHVARDWQQAGQTSAHSLWQAARARARRDIDGLAERIDACATWDDLVLPAPTLALLRSMAAQVRQRHRVLRDWGFAERSSRGLGLGALFAGASGTGKTMAAEVLANHLQLDLYRIDLAALVSKYIGETEKNLSRVFAAAEASGAILLFDEADALFGKRSEVRDSHDRYANLEVSYLLQRIESWRGLAILTSNLRLAIDPAFMRRLRFIVNFPFPDDAARALIWQRAFPPRAPLQDIDVGKLARLSIAGGSIRNVALNAAYLAADDGAAISMRHLRSAADAEFAKADKQLPAADVGDWA